MTTFRMVEAGLFTSLDGSDVHGFLLDAGSPDAVRAAASMLGETVTVSRAGQPDPEIARLTAERDTLRGFAREVMRAWPEGDLPGDDLQDAAERWGLIERAPGGYDPERHSDAVGVAPEKGDPWFEPTKLLASIEGPADE